MNLTPTAYVLDQSTEWPEDTAFGITKHISMFFRLDPPYTDEDGGEPINHVYASKCYVLGTPETMIFPAYVTNEGRDEAGFSLYLGVDFSEELHKQKGQYSISSALNDLGSYAVNTDSIPMSLSNDLIDWRYGNDYPPFTPLTEIEISLLMQQHMNRLKPSSGAKLTPRMAARISKKENKK